MFARATDVKDRTGAWLGRRWDGTKSKVRFVGATLRRGIEKPREMTLGEFIEMMKRDLATMPEFIAAVGRNTVSKLAFWRAD